MSSSGSSLVDRSAASLCRNEAIGHELDHEDEGHEGEDNLGAAGAVVDVHIGAPTADEVFTCSVVLADGEDLEATEVAAAVLAHVLAEVAETKGEDDLGAAGAEVGVHVDCADGGEHLEAIEVADVFAHVVELARGDEGGHIETTDDGAGEVCEELVVVAGEVLTNGEGNVCDVGGFAPAGQYRVLRGGVLGRYSPAAHHRRPTD